MSAPMSNGSSMTNGSCEEPTPSEVLLLSRRLNNAYFKALNNPNYLPLLYGECQIGLLRPDVAKYLLDRYGENFHERPLGGGCARNALSLSPALDTFQKRTEAFDKMLREMRNDPNPFIALKGWREETFDVRIAFDLPPVLKMERAATCLLGVRQYGVDINGYVKHPQKGLCLWMQRRSKTKPTWPGMLDNFVGGGLSTGFGIRETAIKEAEEEANVPDELAQTMVSVGAVTFFFESERGLFPNTEFVFDLELPVDFTPGNNDGEVESFELVPVQEVIPKLLGPDMKTSSAPVALDFLVRWGIINADNESNLPELLENIHMPIHHMFKF